MGIVSGSIPAGGSLHSDSWGEGTEPNRTGDLPRFSDWAGSGSQHSLFEQNSAVKPGGRLMAESGVGAQVTHP